MTKKQEPQTRTAEVRAIAFAMLRPYKSDPTPKAAIVEQACALLKWDSKEECELFVARVLYDLKARRLILYKGGRRNQYVRAASWASPQDLTPRLAAEEYPHPVREEATS